MDCPYLKRSPAPATGLCSGLSGNPPPQQNLQGESLRLLIL